MEASAIPRPAGLPRVPLGLSLLRLRSDEQLLALFRAGNDDAFGVLHDRYRQRLFAYVRQMLASLSRQDAEDVLQDVFVRAYGALRADERDVNVRAWLYRVAHNRCIDHLRRPVPPAAAVLDVSRRPLSDPTEEAQRHEDLARLVQDIGRLPEQQRSALLMREVDGMSYADLAQALDVTTPAVKSLLVRARVGLVDAAEARDADCREIRDDLLQAYDRGVKASGRARRHMRTCSGCAEYRTALRGVRRSFAALSPVSLGPLALAAKLIGASGAGGGAAAGSAAAGGGATAGGGSVAGGALATATAGKVAAVVATAAITAGGAVEAQHIVRRHHEAPRAAAARAPAAPERAARRAHAMLQERRLPHGGGAALMTSRVVVVREPIASTTLPAAIAAPDAPEVAAAEDAARAGGTLAPVGDATAPADVTPTPAVDETDGPAMAAPGDEPLPVADDATPGAAAGDGAPASGPEPDAAAAIAAPADAAPTLVAPQP